MGPKIAEAQAAVTPNPSVSVDRICKVFMHGGVEVPALRSVTLSIATGEFVAIMGPSGSGKSTLLHLIAGLELPTSGTIYVGGQCVTAMNDDQVTIFRRRHIGFIYQHFNFLGDLTLEENVGAPLMLDGCGAQDIAKRVEAALEQVDLLDRRRYLPSTVSGGELQRAAIARALIMEPAVLLADEPTGNLDSVASEHVLMEMRRAVDDLKRTIVLVTHNEIASSYADRTIRLLDGEVQERSLS